jgi:hypothetical protein
MAEDLMANIEITPRDAEAALAADILSPRRAKPGCCGVAAAAGSWRCAVDYRRD